MTADLLHAKILQSAEGVAGCMPGIKVRIDRLRRHFPKGHEAHQELLELHLAFAEVLAGANEITASVQALPVPTEVTPIRAVPVLVTAEDLELHPSHHGRGPDRRKLAGNDRNDDDES